MIRLRKIEPADLPFLYQWENDALAWTDGSNHNPLSQQDLRDYIASTSGDIYRDGQLRMIIEEVNESSLAVHTIGCIDLFDFDPRNRRAAMGLYITPDARGRHAAELALRQMEKYAFSFLHLRLLYAVIRVGNEACSNLYRKLNYQPSSPLHAWTIEGDAIIWQKYETGI